MARRKNNNPYVSGEKVLAQDLNDTFAEFKFGGTGADGALSVSSGTTNIDLGGAAVFVKNYTSISITGTGKITFSNPHANGTIIIFKSQGDVTLTSSQTPMIDASNLGASGGSAGASGSNNNGSDGSEGYGFNLVTGAGRGGQFNNGASLAANPNAPYRKLGTGYSSKYSWVVPGAGGGGGAHSGDTSKSAGTGGRGGAAFIIECDGAFNFTTASGISVAGQAGTNSSAAGGPGVQVHGGAGGGGGCFFVLYRTLTANSGTVTVSGGSAGTGAVNGTNFANSGPTGGASVNTKSSDGATATSTGTAAAQAGAAGLSIIAPNLDFA